MKVLEAARTTANDDVELLLARLINYSVPCVMRCMKIEGDAKVIYSFLVPAIVKKREAVVFSNTQYISKSFE
ncbi:hypothetical protein [Pustulibacterium marinum]|uniref:hypothetical protein n=1 Tax=Pustulibacterium marinum TaxID=1224947 RepID=UPI000B840608|nr:hypothetical protein [Pustulibacterium marinum]